MLETVVPQTWTGENPKQRVSKKPFGLGRNLVTVRP
jgi:hypothetical protein